MVKRNLVSPLQNVELFQNLNALFDMFEIIFLKNFLMIFVSIEERCSFDPEVKTRSNTE